LIAHLVVEVWLQERDLESEHAVDGYADCFARSQGTRVESAHAKDRRFPRSPANSVLLFRALRWRLVTLWDELALPWQVCLEQAWAAYRVNSLPIGAAVVDPRGDIVGRGRNRIFEPPAEQLGAHSLAGHRLAHAEMNALLSVDHVTVNIKECVLYTTLEPCALCVGAVRMLGMKEVRYAARDPAAGGLGLLDATDFMRRGGVHAEHLGCLELEAALIAMTTAALLSVRPGTPAIDPWEAAGLPGVRLGRELSASGELRRTAAGSGPSVAQVIDELARRNGQVEGKAAPGPSASGVATPSPVVLLLIGAPASGKSTLGRQLATALGMPYLSKDLFKETLFDTLGWEDRGWSQQLGSASMALLFRSAAELLQAGQTVALDSTFYPRVHESQLRALRERYGCQLVQIVCTAPGPTLVERFERRALSGERHPGHADAASLDEFRSRLLTEHWEALDLGGPVLTVDTSTGDVDIEGLARRIRQLSKSNR
jgi:tRNA(Arg) A34 adenosine deaminase TadA/predicted kinase